MGKSMFSSDEKDTFVKGLDKAFDAIGFPQAYEGNDPPVATVPVVPKRVCDRKKPSEKTKRIERILKDHRPAYNNSITEMYSSIDSLTTLGFLYILESLVGTEGAYVNYTILHNSVGLARKQIRHHVNLLKGCDLISVSESDHVTRGKFIKLNYEKANSSIPPMRFSTESIIRSQSVMTLRAKELAVLFFWCCHVIQQQPEKISSSFFITLISKIEKNDYDSFHIAAIIFEHLPKVKTNPLAYIRKVFDTGASVEPGSMDRVKEIEAASQKFFLRVGTNILPTEWEVAAKTLGVSYGYGLNTAEQIQEQYTARIDKFSTEITNNIKGGI